MELKASTTVLLIDFSIGSPSLYVDTHGLPHVVKVAWLAVLGAGVVLATALHFNGD